MRQKQKKLEDNEIDLHGFRLLEAHEEVIKFLDRLHYEGEGTAYIIHGLGMISQKLPNWLKELPYVKSHELNPWNRGVTIVRLG